jgi:hypothetical protein
MNMFLPLRPLSSSLQQRNKRHAHQVRAIHIGHIGRAPVLIRDIIVQVLLELCSSLSTRLSLAGSNACIVDEDVEEAVLALDLLDELVDVGFLGHVALQGDDLAGNVLAMDGLDGLELLEGAAHDVDL